MAEKKSDVLEPRFDGALIQNKYVKAGLFVVKTRAQRNSIIKTLYRTLDGETTTLCYVSADRAMYELISNPSSEGTTDQDWKILDFGVSDIITFKGTWDFDNTTPALTDALAENEGNKYYITTGAPTPTVFQDPNLFGGQSVTIVDGDWIISNGEQWFVSPSPIGWDAITGRPTVIDEYVAGQIFDHQHAISGANGVDGLQAALDLKFDESDTVDGTIDPATELDAALTDVLFVKTNYYNKGETYSQSQIDTKISAISPLSAKGDIYTHNGTVNSRLPVGTDGFVLVADSGEALGVKWAAAAETGWKTIGETVLTGASTITHNHNELIHDLGALEVSGFTMIADLDTSLGINLFRFNHQALSDHTEGFTEVYFGSNNGNSGSEAWGNIMFGQNNANSLLATGEFDGGRNIIGGFNNGDGFSALSTHNIIFGRKSASSAGELSYSIVLGYEALNGASSTAPDGKQNVVAIGAWSMQNLAFTAEVGTETYNSNIVAIGTEAGADGIALYDAGNIGTDRGGAESALLLGTRAAFGATIEKYEIIIGNNAANGAVMGRGNITIGTLAGASMTGGLAGNYGSGGATVFNTLVGTHTGEFLEGDKNAFFATEAGSSAVIGSFNSGFGNWALNRITGDYNAAFGAYAGYNVVTPLTGDYNAFFGGGATYDSASPNFDNSILIATNYTQLMVSDKIYIGSITQNVIFNGALTRNDAEGQIAVINSSTGELEYRDISSIAGGTISEAPVDGTPYARQDNAWITTGGGGDVTKVGTPANNQIGVWTGNGTIEGTNDFIWTGTSLSISGEYAGTSTAQYIQTLTATSTGTVAAGFGVGISFVAEHSGGTPASLGQIAMIDNDGTTQPEASFIIRLNRTGATGILEMFKLDGNTAKLTLGGAQSYSPEIISEASGTNVDLKLTAKGAGGVIVGQAANKIGFYNTNPIVQPAHIADATDAASAITQLNLLLAKDAALGLQASS